MSPSLDPKRSSLGVVALIALATTPFAQHPVSPGTSGVHQAGGDDLDPLFVTPSTAEIQAVLDDWALRPPQVDDLVVESTRTLADGRREDVVSHRVDGLRQYALLRYPRNHGTGDGHPVILYCHQNAVGLSNATIDFFESHLPTEMVQERFFLLAPTFRAETLTVTGTPWTSEGQASLYDRDVDDAMGALVSVLAAHPEADPLRIVAYGASRGGTVALLLSQRTPLVRTVVDMYGSIDHRLPSLAADAQTFVDGGDVNVHAILRYVYEDSILPWLIGQFTLEQARNVLTRSSMAILRPTELVDLEIHHGALDDVVTIEHSDTLTQVLGTLGNLAPDWEYYTYPNGSHGIETLEGQGARVEARCEYVRQLPRSYCPGAVNSTGVPGRIDWEGDISIAANRFWLLARDLPTQSFGLFFYGLTRAQVPFGDGTRCIAAPLYRLGLEYSGLDGEVSHHLDFTAPPEPGATITAGIDWNFQLWYRDSQAGLSGWNLTGGMTARFLP